MESAAQELMRSFEAVAPEVIGRKLKRKLLRGMHEWLMSQTRTGPWESNRREAVQIMESAVRLCEAKRAE